MSESVLTKKAIAKSLKELTRSVSFDKITIRDISEACGINRQTFYYHFSDKYDLLKWIYYTDYLQRYTEDISFSNWKERLTSILTSMKNDSFFCINTFRHTDAYIHDFLVDIAEEVFGMAIDDIDTNHTVTKDEHHYFSRFFAYGLNGIISEWVNSGMETEPETISDYLYRLLISSETAAYKKVTGELRSGMDQKPEC